MNAAPRALRSPRPRGVHGLAGWSIERLVAAVEAEAGVAARLTGDGDHVHHDAAETWLGDGDFTFATCPITEGSLVRLLVREGQSAAVAASMLSALADHARHDFWPDDVAYRQVDLGNVLGHRQVTDAYLASLARSREGRLATFDRGLAVTFPDVVDLVSVD